MRTTRMLLLFVLTLAVAAALAGAFASTAGALAFSDNPCPPQTVNGVLLKVCPEGETGKLYSVQLLGRAGTGCYPNVKFSLIAGTALPTGLTLSSSGLISGTPSAAGMDTFWVSMADTEAGTGCATPCPNPQCESTEREFSITIVQGLTIDQRQSTLTPAQLNTPYSYQLTAKGGGTQTWSIVPNSGTPPAGITINSSTGLISGTATAAGDYTFKVQVTDGTRSDTQTYTLSVVQQLKVTSLAAPAAEVGQPFAMTLTATGGKPGSGYTWSLANGASLPAGLTLDGAKGTITGRPTVAGKTTVQVTVTDSLKLTSTVNLKIGVAAPLAIIKRVLPTAKAGRAYRARVWTQGGVAPKRWTIVGGSLPAGIHLNARTGALTGAARHAGRSRVTVEVSDKFGVVSKATFVLKVVA